MTVGDRAIEAVECHASVRQVLLVGSRAAGTATAFSDWDFAIETDDFAAVARDIGGLLVPLDPLTQQWDRLSETWCWMAILRGPAKLDFIFAESHSGEPPWQPRRANLAAIDDHFWDWAMWLKSKQARDDAELERRELDKLFVHILDPMGVATRPQSLDEALSSYLKARDRLEGEFGVSVPRALEHEVVPILRAGPE